MSNPSKLIAALFCFAYALSARVGAHAANAIDIVVPPESGTNNNGNSLFRLFDAGAPIRFQQVFDAGTFGALNASGGGYIAVIAFRLDVSSHPFAQTIPNL